MFDFYDALLELDEKAYSFSNDRSKHFNDLDEIVYHELDLYFADKWQVDPLKPCVYLRNNTYIGSSFNILKRYDSDVLETIQILQSFENGCTRDELRKREQFYIDEYTTQGYRLLNKIDAYRETK